MSEELKRTETVRKDFEAWALKNGFKEGAFKHRVGGDYLNQYLADYWYCWQAARATPPAPVEGQALPPLDPQYLEIVRPRLSDYGVNRFLNGDTMDLYPDDLRAIIDRSIEFVRQAIEADRRARSQDSEVTK